ncbi:hypothetical protein PAXINDRAFT_93539, partial [Paxillus involutus ATCC 200175]
QNYLKPTIDPKWLSDCCQWISFEHNISHFHRFIEHVELQVLRSYLEDSAVPGSGTTRAHEGRAGWPGINRDPLRDHAVKRNDRTRTPHRDSIEPSQASCNLLSDSRIHTTPRQQVEECEGPVPRFPRGVLMFELSNGCTTFSDIEFRSLAKLESGIMPLGHKVRSACFLCVYAPTLSSLSSLGNYPTPSSRFARESHHIPDVHL